jgi:hypothetical protein
MNPRPVERLQAEQLRQYGADPALGRSLFSGLRDAYRVVAFGYEGQVVRAPKPETLTRQFVTLYQALQGFDERATQARITCPRLCFVGSVDEVQFGKTWGPVGGVQGGPPLSA